MLPDTSQPSSPAFKSGRLRGFLIRGEISPTGHGACGGSGRYGYRIPKLCVFGLALVMGIAVMQTVSNTSQENQQRYKYNYHTVTRKSVLPLTRSSTTAKIVYQHEVKPVLRNPSDFHVDKCRFYMAESAVAPNAGLGMFAGAGLLPGDMVGFPDICVFVTDPPHHWTHMHSHTWGQGMYFGQHGEGAAGGANGGSGVRVACEGYSTIYNTMPDSHLNVRIQSAIQQTHAGATRATPGAGSTTHHFGVHGIATDTIPPGSELTVNYYDWDFSNQDYQGVKRPQRDLQDLEDNGWCVDHIEIRPSTIPAAGRGAFVKRPLPKGTVIVPAPLQVFADRADFQHSEPEQLYVNYCLQPEGSRMLFYPYGPGVNLINHDARRPNVGLQWSTKPFHHAELLTLNYTAFWKKVRPGSLILEVVALRDLVPGDELFLDYGSDWDKAWKAHVKAWQPPEDAEDHVYPENMDETEFLRTVEEQQTDPYPANLITMCNSHVYGRSKAKGNLHQKWWDSQEEEWWWNMAYCHILDRKVADNGSYEYTVSLIVNREGESGSTRKTSYTDQDLIYNATTPFQDLMVDTHVPRRAIRWIEKPFHDDEHLMNAFRHPIGFPSNLVSMAWITEE